MALKDITAGAVRAAVAEFEKLGRSAFLRKYGFRRARSYFLIGGEGQRYDSKAIVGAAHGHLESGAEPLTSDDFSGGDATVATLLESLGFTVEKPDAKQKRDANAGRGSGRKASEMGPLILVENERTEGGRYDHWQDATGERYQFPNSYKNKVIPGRRFIYYRGARRADGSRSDPEYFGNGVIGEVHRDPETDQSDPKARWKYYCDIEIYEPFQQPVSFRDGDSYIESIAQNQWSVGVREITDEQYDLILHRARVDDPTSSQSNDLDDEVPVPIEGQGLLAVLQPSKGTSGAGGGGGGGQRRSRESKAVGDRGEHAVLNWLRANLPSEEAETLVHDAEEGRRPGYDLSYESGGQLVGVEVKATRGSAFPSVEITANEWQAAKALGGRYRLALVASAMTSSPRIDFIDDPAGLVDEGALMIETSVHKVTRRPEGEAEQE